MRATSGPGTPSASSLPSTIIPRRKQLPPPVPPALTWWTASRFSSATWSNASMTHDPPRRWAIHPDQVAVINRAFTPSHEEIVRAQEILELYSKADANSGIGAMVYKDEMVDAASLPIEQKKLAVAKKTGLI